MNIEKIDEALEKVLRASGSSLKNYSMQITIDAMREEMKSIMLEQQLIGEACGAAKAVITIEQQRTNRVLDCYGITGFKASTETVKLE